MSGLDPGGFGLFVTGENFVNSTSLACRVGGSNTAATFLLPSLVLCFVPRAALATTISFPEGADGRYVTRGLGPREGDGSSPGVWLGPYNGDGTELFVEVSMHRYDTHKLYLVRHNNGSLICKTFDTNANVPSCNGCTLTLRVLL